MGSARFVVEPLDATFGARITGVELAHLDEQTFEKLYAAWLDYALLIFPGQHLSKDAQVAFARRFGDLEFEIAPLSNVRADGSLRPDDDSDDVMKVLKGNMGWHADSTYMPVQAKGAVFTAHVVPGSGGQTGWADMRAAYEALDPAQRHRIEPLAAFHSLYHSQARLGHVPKQGSNYSGYGIPGMDAEASDTLLQELVEFACQAPRVYYHAWSAGDAVLWDNRCLLHRACPWDMQEPRVMYHSRIAGDAGSET